MTTTTQPKATLATRFGYRAGAVLRNARVRIARFESSCIGHAEIAYGASCGFAMRAAFLIGKIAALVLALAVSVWLAVTVLTLLAVAYAVARGFPGQPKDFYHHQAYGDPYGEYELHRLPGQPDLDEK